MGPAGSESQLDDLREQGEKRLAADYAWRTKGVIEIRNYRNPLEVTPHVAITIDFETLDNWRDFIDSQDYIRIMRELRILGCNNFTVNVWAPSKYFPESMKP